MAVSVVSRGARFETAPARALFALPSQQQYEPSPDGQRFLVTMPVSEASPIMVIVNWKRPVR